MKKLLIPALGLLLLLGACNEKVFLKKLQNTWKLDKYLFSGADKTLYFDTTFRNYTLDIANDNRYTISYQQFLLNPDSLILADTLGYDTINSQFIVQYDTLRYIDTTILPHLEAGSWELINSQEDLQLRSDSDQLNAVMYRILDLGKSNLTLRKGNEEYYLKN